MQIRASRSYPASNPNRVNVQGTLSPGGSALSGSSLPLVGVKLRVREGVELGQHAQAVTLLRSTTLTPAAQLSNILVRDPEHYDSTGAADGALSVQVGAVRTQGMLLSSSSSPLYDTRPSSGALA